MNLKGSKTETNLRNAFISEAMARCKYVYYAEKAREEGLENVALTYENAARNEQEHAKIWFEHFHKILPTKENLKESIHNESYESLEMYLDYAKTAQEEGFDEIAMLFMKVARIEDGHKKQFKNLLEENDFHLNKWQCTKCGFYEDEKPDICPVCGYHQNNRG